MPDEQATEPQAKPAYLIELEELQQKITEWNTYLEVRQADLDSYEQRLTEREKEIGTKSEAAQALEKERAQLESLRTRFQESIIDVLKPYVGEQETASDYLPAFKNYVAEVQSALEGRKKELAEASALIIDSQAKLSKESVASVQRQAEISESAEALRQREEQLKATKELLERQNTELDQRKTALDAKEKDLKDRESASKFTKKADDVRDAMLDKKAAEPTEEQILKAILKNPKKLAGPVLRNVVELDIGKDYPTEMGDIAEYAIDKGFYKLPEHEPEPPPSPPPLPPKPKAKVVTGPPPVIPGTGKKKVEPPAPPFEPYEVRIDSESEKSNAIVAMTGLRGSEISTDKMEQEQVANLDYNLWKTGIGAYNMKIRTPEAHQKWQDYQEKRRQEREKVGQPAKGGLAEIMKNIKGDDASKKRRRLDVGSKNFETYASEHPEMRDYVDKELSTTETVVMRVDSESFDAKVKEWGISLKPKGKKEDKK